MTSRTGVRLVPHDPRWGDAYRLEAAEVIGVIGSDAAAVEHIGSTAVPGIRAKPIIDIMVGVRGFDAFEHWVSGLSMIGYDYTPEAEADEPARRVFRKGPVTAGSLRTHHLHVTQMGGEYWRRILVFRDHLRTDRDAARAYEALKLDLAERFADEGRRYTAGKAGFVRGIESRALSR